MRMPLARARGGASQEGLVSLLGAERMRSHCVFAAAMGPTLRAGTRLLRNPICSDTAHHWHNCRGICARSWVSLELKMSRLSGRGYEHTAACYPCCTQSRKGRCSTRDLRGRTMLDHMILTVSDVERSLAFYEAALKPLNINSSCRIRAKTVIPICGDLVMAKGRSSG